MEQSPKRILFFCEGISFAHVARSLVVTKWLRDLGLPITVACAPSRAPLFRTIADSVASRQMADPKAIYSRLVQGSAMFETEELLGYFEEDEQLIRELKPGLIASEFRFTALQLANKHGIPCVGLTEATCHPAFIPEGTVPDSFAKPRFLPLEFLDYISQKTSIGRWLTRQTIDRISAPFRKASQAYGLDPLPTFFDYASQGDLCLLCDDPNLIPIANLRPGDLYTGALHWDPGDPAPPELARLDAGAQTVYVSLGTQESLGTDFVPEYVRRMLAHGVQIVLSRGNRPFTLDMADSKLFAFDFVNDLRVIPLTDLLVYPGGAMTTYAALSCGVPLLALPAHANQHFYAEAIARNHLGRFFRPSRLDVEELVKATLGMLSDESFRANARAFQARLLEFQGKGAVLARIRALLSAASSD